MSEPVNFDGPKTVIADSIALYHQYAASENPVDILQGVKLAKIIAINAHMLVVEAETRRNQFVQQLYKEGE